MSQLTLQVQSYFDGQHFHQDGPYAIQINEGVIESINSAPASQAVLPFAMPGLVEAHCHLFLNGAELDFKTRKAYLTAPLEKMLEVGRQSLAENLAAGITLIRDAGDLHGVNHLIREELSQTKAPAPTVRSPGRAIRFKGRYGSFMGMEVEDDQSIVAAVQGLASTGDDIKILLTGIIDFEKGIMKGGPQFDLRQAQLLVKTAHDCGKKTFAHCSGLDGLRIAVEAGIDSIEHGFFIDDDIVSAMADKQIAWVPTFSPVYFQYERPELAGWDKDTVGRLWEILDRHFKHIEKAARRGVPIMAGSDAGSYGVAHGKGLIDELFFQHKAGMPTDQVLASATSVPRRMWDCPAADIAVGNTADMIILSGSPDQSMEHLRQVQKIIAGSHILTPSADGQLTQATC